MQVKELMTRQVEACRPEDSLSRAAQLMWECDCGVVPVVDEQQQVVGIVTDRDICMATYTKDRAPSAIRVGEVMTPDVHCCKPDDSIADAETQMREQRVRRVPIVDGDKKLVGILSMGDLACELSGDKKRGNNGVEAEEVAETLAAVSKPWRELNGGGKSAEGSQAVATKSKSRAAGGR